MSINEDHYHDHGIIEAIFDSIADGIFTVDENFVIPSFNHGAEKITGIPEDQALGKYCFDVLKSDICE